MTIYEALKDLFAVIGFFGVVSACLLLLLARGVER